MTVKKVLLEEDFFTTPHEPIEQVRLRGSRCRNCGVVFLGALSSCENCQGTDIEDTILPRNGKLYSYTIVRNRPPGDYKGPDNPFVPFAVGMVELDEGVMFLSRLTQVEFDELKIGMRLTLIIEPLYIDEDGNEIMMFAFKPVKGDK